jgi:hypothetical protein
LKRYCCIELKVRKRRKRGWRWAMPEIPKWALILDSWLEELEAGIDEDSQN